MPLSQQEADALRQVRDRLTATATALDGMLGAGPAAAAVDADRIAQLRSEHGEAGDYDRHYSTTRSALTALVVTVGLAASADRIKALTSAGAACAIDPFAQTLGITLAATLFPFALTILLFLLAVAVSLYFQRLTFACELIQREAEHRLAALAGIMVPADQDWTARRERFNAHAMPGGAFRADLAVISTHLSYRGDAMTSLLLLGIFTFLGLAVGFTFQPCSSWHMRYTILVAGGAAALGGLIAAILARRLSVVLLLLAFAGLVAGGVVAYQVQ